MNQLPLTTVCVVLSLLGTVVAQQVPSPPVTGPANTSLIEQLKAGKGRELVLANCIPCHSTAVIAASHKTRAGWDQTVTKMQQQHGLWPIDAASRRQILDYLASTQPPSDASLDKGKESPWAHPLYRPNPIW